MAYQSTTLIVLRKCEGITQKQMAARLGVSERHYSKLENGIATPNSAVRERVRDLFGYEIAERFL